MKRIRELVAGDEIAALSLWEPWATLMAIGAKTIETRSWPTSHRGPLLICAAKRNNKGELRDLMSEYPIAKALHGEALNHGSAVCIVNMHSCRSVDHLRGVGSDGPFGDFSRDRWAWLTSNLRRIEPFPVSGKQGVFRVTLPENLRSLS